MKCQVVIHRLGDYLDLPAVVDLEAGTLPLLDEVLKKELLTRREWFLHLP